MFYLHRFINPYSEDYLRVKKEHLQSKKNRKLAFDKMQEEPSNLLYVQNYIEEVKKTDLIWQKLLKTKKEQKFLGFRSFYIFLDRFGLAVLIFTYSLFNLIRSFYYEYKNISSKVFHTFVISVSMFYFFWIFNTFQDFSKLTYFLVTIFSACFITVGVYFFTKYKQSYINKLKGDIREISRFTIVNTKPGKQEEMFEVLTKIAKSQE